MDDAGVAGRELESALLVPVPAAEAAVAAHRARLDSSARDGVPAHLTVLCPFVRPAEIGPAVLAGLSRLFAGVARFSFTLDRVRWFGESVVWLGPADESPFRQLTALAAAAYPSCPPYGGVHADVVPHLTIGHVSAGQLDKPTEPPGPAELRAAADAVRPLLPIRAEATEVTLMAGPPAGRPGPPGQWWTVASFPLG
ncbi:MAG: 2'-5' RNA ligase family protein [Trebonia sp.]|jgi:2'-5' RNA ligase